MRQIRAVTLSEFDVLERQLDEAVRAKMVEGQLNYRDALLAVASQEVELCRSMDRLRQSGSQSRSEYFYVGEGGKLVPVAQAESRGAGEAVDELSRLAAEKAAAEGVPFSQAMKIAASEDPQLVRRHFRDKNGVTLGPSSKAIRLRR